jgi:hypothetical protein
MNQRQLAGVLFAAVGAFIVISQVQHSSELVGALISTTMVDEADPSIAAARVALSASFIGVILAVVCGLILVLLRERVANLLFRPAPESLSSSEVQAVALSVLGCYFVVHALSRLARAGHLDWGSSTQLVLGIALFFSGRGLARLWAVGGSSGNQVDAGGRAL